jgi:hypothetical protein
MTKSITSLLLLLLSIISIAQTKNGSSKYNNKLATAQVNPNDTVTNPKHKAPIDWYKVITVDNDTTYIDTTLTIKKEYVYNYLRKDTFGLIPFANEGQTYNTLQYGLNETSPLPDFGFEAKQFNFLQANQIKYYSVATPLTELYFKTVMKQGQSLDSFITINTSEQFNFSIAYKGLRSVGRYVNQLSSTGNFRFTANYNSKNKRYFLKAHFTSQDILNGENGGIINNADFESNAATFNDRARLQVYLTDATTSLEGNRYFFDHIFRINKENRSNNLYLTHQFNFENKFFEYMQPTVLTSIINSDGTTNYVSHFGDAYVSSNIDNKTRYNKLYNKVGAIYENKTLGQFQFFLEDLKYNYYYNSVLVINNAVIPSSLNDRIDNVGGQYKYQKNKWKGNFQYTNSISKQALSNLDLHLEYYFNPDNQISFHYQKLNKLPNHIYDLYQSSYIKYNWNSNFKNEKINNFDVSATTKWVDLDFQLSVLNDKLFFSKDNLDANILIVSPKQYDKTINYLSFKISKDFQYRKWGFDNTFLYQKVDQSNSILNVPTLVARNTLYFSDFVFKRAMYIQTGVTLNYFSKYFANDYNPLIGEFYVQEQKKIGDFPLLDFFINAKVKQTRIYLKAEHFNSAFSGNNYYAAPGYPYRDFVVRFGLVWNFFQ